MQGKRTSVARRGRPDGNAVARLRTPLLIGAAAALAAAAGCGQKGPLTLPAAQPAASAPAAPK